MIRQTKWLLLAIWCCTFAAIGPRAAERPPPLSPADALTHLQDALAAGRQAEAEAMAAAAAGLARQRFAEEPLAEADFLLDLAAAEQAGALLAAAAGHLERAVALRTAKLGAASGPAAEALERLAAAQGEQGDAAAAERNHRLARERLTAAYGPDDARTGAAARGLGRLYVELRRYHEAEPLLLDSARIARDRYGATHEAFAYELIGLGELYGQLLRFSEAERAFAAAYPILKERLGEKHAATAHLFDRIGNMYLVRGRFADAERAHRRALEIRRSLYGPDHIEVAQSASNLGLVLHNLARFQEAEALFRAALAIYEAHYGLAHPYAAAIVQNLALVYFWQGRYEEAELLFRRAIDIRTAKFGGEHKITAGSYNTLAHVYLRREQWGTAEPLLARAARIWSTPPDADPYLAAEAQLWLGAAQSGDGQLEQGAATLKAAIDTIEQRMGRAFVSVARGTERLAETVSKQGRHQEATRLYEQALATYREIGGPEYILTITGLSAEARGAARAGDLPQALNFGREAIAGLRGRLAKLNSASGRATRAEVASLREVVIEHVEIARQAGAADPAILAETFEAAQLARATGAAAAVAQMAARFAGGDDDLGRLVRRRQDAVERWRQLDATLAAAAFEDPQRRDLGYEAGVRRDAQALASAIAALDAELDRSFPAYRELANPRPESLATVRQLLRGGEMVVSYLVGRQATYVWAVDAERAVLHRSPLGRANLEEIVKELRAGVDPEGVTSIATLPRYDVAQAHRLYQELMAPLEPLLADARHVMVVPDDSLQSFPFGLLVTGAATEQPRQPEDYGRVPWFGLRYAVTVLPSVGALKALRVFAARTQAGRAFLGFGNPLLQGPQPNAAPPPSNLPVGPTRGYRAAYRGGKVDPDAVRQLDPLPETEDELRRIAGALNAGPDDLNLAERASERRFRGAGAESYRILVFATHGLMAGDFTELGEPALVMTPPATAAPDDDGLLTASEIAGMHLNADWVVLSACNTAADDGTPGAEGLSGLAKAFFHAGTRAMLVSHWPVASDAAAKLTTGAFAALDKEPTIGRAEAMRRSMQDLANSAEQPHFAHPLFWAPFSVVGEGGAAD